MKKEPWEIMNEAFDRIFAAFDHQPATDSQPEAASAACDTAAPSGDDEPKCTEEIDCECAECEDGREYERSRRQDLIWAKGGL